MDKAKKLLEDEIKTLERELRHDMPKILNAAVALGDLRENAEYHTAKERKQFLEARIGQLRSRLSNLSMADVSKIPEGKVSYGSTVELRDEAEGTEMTYQLVTAEESDISKGKISVSSPIGKSLIGKEEGDEVAIRTPSGVRNLVIEKLTTVHDQK